MSSALSGNYVLLCHFLFQALPTRYKIFLPQKIFLAESSNNEFFRHHKLLPRFRAEIEYFMIIILRLSSILFHRVQIESGCDNKVGHEPSSDGP